MPLVKPFTPLCCCKKRSLLASLSLLALFLLLAWLTTKWKQVSQKPRVSPHDITSYRLSPHFSTARHDLSLRKEWEDLANRAAIHPSQPPGTGAAEDRYSVRFSNAESDQTSNSTRQESGRHRYVLAMNYWEQFNMAVRNYYNLACLAAHWDANTVLPFTHNSRLYGLDDVKLDEYFNATTSAHELDLIFNIRSLDSVLRQKGLPAVRTLRDMLLHGSRRVVFLHFIAEKFTREYKIRSWETVSFLKRAFKSSGIVDCSTQPELLELSHHITSKLNEQAGKIHAQRRKTFRMDQYYCVSMNHSTSPVELAARLGFSRDKNLSVVVINWRGTNKDPMMRVSAKGTHLNNRILMTNICSLSNTVHVPINFSRSVVDTSHRFLQQMHLRRNRYVAVHIRSEKMYLRQGRFPGLVSSCVKEALHTVGGLLRRESSQSPLPVIYFYDLGQYGSETCKNCKVIGQVKDILRKNGIAITHFDPELYNVTDDSGFVAAVEMETIARARHLILVGGGAFQNQAALRYGGYRSNLRDGSGKSELVWVCESDAQAAELMNRTLPH